jgi:hypothetical protein
MKREGERGKWKGGEEEGNFLAPSAEILDPRLTAVVHETLLISCRATLPLSLWSSMMMVIDLRTVYR